MGRKKKAPDKDVVLASPQESAPQPEPIAQEAFTPGETEADSAPALDAADQPGVELCGESLETLPLDGAAEPTELKLVPAEPEPDADPQEPGAELEAGAGEPVLIDPSVPEINTQQVIEAVLFVADTPLPIPKIVSILGVGSARDVRKHIEALNERYTREGATFHIEKIAGGYQMLTLPQYNTWLRRLRQSRQDSRFSAAALETLAVVAYKQPVTRADIEAIRGVAAGEMLNRLRELNLVKIVGRAEDVGRPMLYGTTKRFLEIFGLASLDELPQVEQLQIAQ
jgi:segregation and condensation protein B